MARPQGAPLERRFRGWLIALGHATEDELAAADERGAESAEKAWEFARESPYPDEKELLTDVFAGTSPDANTLKISTSRAGEAGHETRHSS